ncbi:hypothetical protein K1T71_004037 [Dendrolimus kikuchii]|uniref:Uncharacterized protein n=1 Tax=Dendrolimus kikuchii TaxID=765133 RepID=A0ACC1D9N7_9NEOP|nr:hypothetical protein K1T71_004037 [Dendrolimus kikuchii]
MIANLQETVSQLVYLKRDVKKFKDEIVSKDNIIAALQREKETIIHKHEKNIMELRNDHEKYVEDITLENEKKFTQKQLECDTKVAQFTCAIEELKSKIKEMEVESRDKINVVVLEYEEKIQRGAAHVAQLQEQLEQQAARTEANIDVYRRRLEELEEKLKQSNFKHYLAQSVYPSSYENQVERPYSVNRDPYPDNSTIGMDSITEYRKPNPANITQNRPPKQNNLQVIVNKPPKTEKVPDKKGLFNITKKRKLLDMKDFVQF